VIVEGERWRRLFSVSPMRGMSAVHDWFQFVMPGNHEQVVAQCRIVAHDITSGECTFELRGANDYLPLAQLVRAELSDAAACVW